MRPVAESEALSYGIIICLETTFFLQTFRNIVDTLDKQLIAKGFSFFLPSAAVM